jgi:hypothetical protein
LESAYLHRVEETTLAIDRVDPMSLSTIKEWNDSFGGDLDVWSYVRYRDDFAFALALSHVLWPTFVEIQGCILLESSYSKADFRRLWSSVGGNRSAVEALLNEVHLYDIFPGFEDSDDKLLEDFGHVMVRMWRCALSEQFPGRCLDLVLDVGEDQYGPTISLYSHPSVEEQRDGA